MAKKLISLLMAVMLIMGISVIPAAAATPEDEGIDPQGTSWCGNCGASSSSQQTRWDIIDYSERTSGCTEGASGCRGDYTARKYSGSRCRSCGSVYSSSLIDVGVYCPVWGGFYY